MISDYVKGKKQFDFPPLIQQGIRLHRAIDEFTDNHMATREIKAYFRPQYRLYAGAFTDVAYDFFLANDKQEFALEQTLADFSQEVYGQLELYKEYFPERFARMFPYMREYNWLCNYRLETGIEKSFEGLVRRSAYLTESAVAFRLFSENKEVMKTHYEVFFPELKQFAIHKLNELLK